MSEKKNFWTQVWSAMNGALSFGSLSPKKDVRSCVKLRGLDGRHFLTMDEDGVREGWTTLNSPGATQFNTGEDLKKGQNAFFVNAENGDVIIRARNGKVRIEGLDVEISATGNNPEGTFWVKANDAVKIDAKNITLDAKQGLKLLTTGLLTLDGKLGMQILSPIVKGASCATDPAKKPGKIR
jgi:hypothetical protein